MPFFRSSDFSKHSQRMAVKGWFLSLSLVLATTLAHASDAAGRDWRTLAAQAKGQTVYFNAWAGSEAINAYIQWVAAAVQAQYGVTLKHVKIADIADVVNRVRAEKQAGRDRTSGTVDLMWINGENFAAMKRDGLLGEPFTQNLPNFKWVDTVNKPTTLIDFSVPTDGLEAPWGMAQLTFFSDSKRVPNPPIDLETFAAMAQQFPGRLTYPRPPDFHGTTFLKQVILATASDMAVCTQPATDPISRPLRRPCRATWINCIRHCSERGSSSPTPRLR